MSEPSPTALTLTVLGGASGVGKSTLLEVLPGVAQLNTGTFFKNRMSLASRDDVRRQPWPAFEDAVRTDLVGALGEIFRQGRPAVLDTHFAAKTPGGEYRVGLRSDLLVSLGEELRAFADAREQVLRIKVVLARCDAHALLQRRRLDTRRDRELVAADCFNALRENDHCSLQYSDAFRRSLQGQAKAGHRVQAYVVNNDDLSAAQAELQAHLND